MEMTEVTTYYEHWQLERFGNILPGSEQQPTEIENGTSDETNIISLDFLTITHI